MGKEDNTSSPKAAGRRRRRGRESRPRSAAVDAERRAAWKNPVDTIVVIEAPEGGAHAEAVSNKRTLTAAQRPTRHEAIRDVGVRLKKKGHPLIGRAKQDFDEAMTILMADARSRCSTEEPLFGTL